jgi:hypothetical protein
MDQKKNHKWRIISLRSSEPLVIIWLGSTQAMGQRQKGGNYGIAGKA